MMNTLTIGKILKIYRDHFTEYEIKQLKEVLRTPSTFAAQVQNLRAALFGEEWDFMNYEIGQNGPSLSQDYLDRVEKKRAALGVSPMNGATAAPDNSSLIFCEEVVRHTKNYKELLELKRRNGKQTVFVDMDGVLVNFQSGIDKLTDEERKEYQGRLDEVPGIFALMEPNDGAIEGYRWLCQNFDTYILSTAPWDNPSAWIDKLLWVKKYLPNEAYKRLTLSHNKHLLKGDFLIDDRTANGAGEFTGKHVHFGPDGHKDFGDWKAVVAYLKNLA